MNYVTYIASHRWRTNPARVAELKAAGGRCRICFDQSSLEAHHATYERLGCETVGDVLAVCRPCHVEITAFLRSRRYSGKKPVRMDVPHLRDTRRPLFDPTR
jgi:hypothetical protein